MKVRYWQKFANNHFTASRMELRESASLQRSRRCSNVPGDVATFVVRTIFFGRSPLIKGYMCSSPGCTRSHPIVQVGVVHDEELLNSQGTPKFQRPPRSGPYFSSDPLAFPNRGLLIHRIISYVTCAALSSGFLPRRLLKSNLLPYRTGSSTALLTTMVFHLPWAIHAAFVLVPRCMSSTKPRFLCTFEARARYAYTFHDIYDIGKKIT
jgi:hypothetical protein